MEMREGDGGYAGALSGGFSRLDGPAWAFVLDDLTLSSAAGGCAQEPTGELDVQDQAGTWYTIRFDGDTSCDGCGEAWAGDTDLGAACTDFTSLSTFRTDPWEG
jgi:hypothetical protein